MFGYKKIILGDTERALVYRDKQFEQVLSTGTHTFWDFGDHLNIRVFDIRNPEVITADIQQLVERHPQLASENGAFQVVELSPTEAGLLYIDGKLGATLGPDTRKVYWRGISKIDVKIFDINEDFAIDLKLARQLTKSGNSMLWVEVPAQHVGLMNVDGVLERVLSTGTYAFWKFRRDLKVDIVDLRWQPMEVSGQEILTKDRVMLRVNLSALWRVVDAKLAATELKRYDDYLYRELQFGLRQAVATRSLDELLGDKGALEQEVFAYIRDRLNGPQDGKGIEVSTVGVKDIILPGDMKDILYQVVAAEKAAQANVIRRREEAAATRSLLNTAKLMDDNPTLLRLKELEALEVVTEKIGSMTVFGGLDGVMNELVKLRA